MATAPPIVQANKDNLLGLIQTTCGELGIRQPPQIFGSTDNQVIQLLALAQREGKQFYKRCTRISGWQQLRKQYVFNLQGYNVDLSGNSITGNITAGSPLITNVSYAGAATAPNASGSWQVLGSDVPYDANIVGISGTTITMDQNNTVTKTGEVLSFAQTAYAFPADFGYYQTMTSWDRSFRWQMLGPLEAQEWQVLKSGISPTGPRRRFRIMQGFWQVDPPLTSGNELIVFEYFSNAWCQSVSGTAQSFWAMDTDFYSLDDDCFILGLKWRWKAAKGLDYQQEKVDYEMLCDLEAARNGGNRDLPLNAQASGIRLLSEQNVPDTGFGT